MNDTDHETVLYTRIAKKQQKNLMLPRELCYAIDEVADDRKESNLVERAVWTFLVDEYGREFVQELIEEAQGQVEPHQMLRDHDTETVTLPA